MVTSYGGRAFDRRAHVNKIVAALPTLEFVVKVAGPHDAPVSDGLGWHEVLAQGETELTFEQVTFDQPLWIVYSSGTTGLPKPIVHGHGGIVLEHLKFLGLHLDIKPGDRTLWYSSSGWIMWNLGAVAPLLLGPRPLSTTEVPLIPICRYC